MLPCASTECEWSSSINSSLFFFSPINSSPAQWVEVSLNTIAASLRRAWQPVQVASLQQSHEKARHAPAAQGGRANATQKATRAGTQTGNLLSQSATNCCWRSVNFSGLIDTQLRDMWSLWHYLIGIVWLALKRLVIPTLAAFVSH